MSKLQDVQSNPVGSDTPEFLYFGQDNAELIVRAVADDVQKIEEELQR